jgi:mannose-6-phosphate isomerase-like protein (cupin superfamily)
MRARMLLLAGLAALALPTAAAAQNNQREAVTTISPAEAARADEILRDFAEDYRNDPMAINTTFGIKLGDAWWTVAVERKETATPRGRLVDHAFGPHAVSLTRGMPATPTWYFEIANLEVLELIASGQVNAGTASMQSFSSDKVGVETRDMPGFTSTSGDEADLYLALSHFFTKGKPEVTRFSRATSLGTHGAQATSLHTMKGFRILHFSIGPEEQVNADPRLEFGQMPNLFVVTSGTGTLYSDDGPIALEKGMSVFVAQFVKHRLANTGTEPLEGILVLYGDNSDFAFGTSYPSYLQDLNQFHRTYPFAKPKPKAK